MEGKIRSGKSTLLEGLAQEGYKVYNEPVQERWKENQHHGEVGLYIVGEVMEWFKQFTDHL